MLNSPKEMFKIYPIIQIDYVFNNNIFYILCVLFIILLLYYWGTNEYSIIPSNYGIICESFYYSV